MDTDVVIVGGGPSGLVLGLFLAQHQIKSTILEKECDITTDPRGVVLTGDAVRSLWKLGLGKCMAWIGHELDSLNFHDTTILNEPFLKIPIDADVLEHALPTTILQSQPRLELALRDLVKTSKQCTLQSACEVVEREEDEQGIIVHYLNRDNKRCHIRAPWLVGADGKRGVVRKCFLEERAGIRQEAGIFKYEGTWIAANLKITLPTRESHPDFPLWACGYTEEAVYDLFWPAQWHFCRPPGKPVACGRFGPRLERLWRHEFAVPELKVDETQEISTVLWEHLIPMITRRVPASSRETVPVTFPRDCIQVLRCRPFRFSHKVVNRWFSGRIALIGDAAHVFPPFGGQGVACGIADAEGLAWRLAVLTRLEKSRSHQGAAALHSTLLQSWAEERRSGVDKSATLTLQNGELCNREPSWTGALQIAFLKLIIFLSRGAGLPLPRANMEAYGYRGCPQGAFRAGAGGGHKLGQIFVQTSLPKNGSVIIELSDQALRRVPTIFSLLVIHSDNCRDDQDAELCQLLLRSTIHPAVLSIDSQVHFDLRKDRSIVRKSTQPVSVPAPLHLLTGYPVRPGYDVDQFQRRLHDQQAKYFIIRPDSIVYASARHLRGLEECMEAMRDDFP